MKKRILGLVLALSMMISLFPVSALAQTPGGGTAVLAEENGTTYDGPLEIDNDPASKRYGKPVADPSNGLMSLRKTPITMATKAMAGYITHGMTDWY